MLRISSATYRLSDIIPELPLHYSRGMVQGHIVDGSPYVQIVSGFVDDPEDLVNADRFNVLGMDICNDSLRRLAAFQLVDGEVVQRISTWGILNATISSVNGPAIVADTRVVPG